MHLEAGSPFLRTGPAGPDDDLEHVLDPKDPPHHRPRRVWIGAVLVAAVIGVLAVSRLAGLWGDAGTAKAARPRPARHPLTVGVYRRAAATCPGLSWSVLAAIHEIESARTNGPLRSSAGARGPMQFLPSTWAVFGVDGNGDGRADINDPVDAVYGASRYLCANGAGDPAQLPNAIWNYNHSEDYVQRVLQLAADFDRAKHL